MGDLQTEAVQEGLAFVPPSTFESVLALPPSAGRTRLFAELCRINVLYMVAAAGSGHIGSSFSSLDIVAWLHLDELSDGDRYFSSKGHDVPGLYSVLIALGTVPFDQLHRLRRRGGLPGHPDVSTPGIAANTGSLGMGISKGKGMVLANRLAGRAGRVVVLTGDGELQEGQLWESLVSAANLGLHELTMIVDHNKLQSDTFLVDVNDLGDLEAKFSAYGWEVRRCDGHDLDELSVAMRGPRGKPRVIIADTVKGQGVSFMEHTSIERGELYRFHSGAPATDDYVKALTELLASSNRLATGVGAPKVALEAVPVSAPPPPTKMQRLIPTYGESLVAHADANDSIVALDADLVLDVGLIPFREKHPSRFIECGIAEQDMVSMAGALAGGGYLPVVHSFASFLSARPNEQIYNNMTEGRRVIYVGSLAGVLPGGPGHSHQAVRDIAALRGIPGLEMISPASELQLVAALEYVFDTSASSCYLRLCSVPFGLPTDPLSKRLERGRGQLVTDDAGDVVLTVYSPVLLPEAIRARTLLEDHQIRLGILVLPFLDYLDADWFIDIAGKANAVITLDDHYVDGGQGQLIATTLMDRGISLRTIRLGLQSIPTFGSPSEVLEAHGLDAKAIAESVVTLS